MNLIFKGSLICLAVFSGSRVEAAPSAEDLGVVEAPQGTGHLATSAGKASAKAAKVSESNSSCPPEGALFLPTGFSFAALLPDSILSYAVSAPVLATLEADIIFRGKIVFPRGTHLIGNAGAMHTLDRVNITWSLAVFPEGCEFPISAIALSADDGAVGVKGRLEKHTDGIAANIALRSMLTAAGTAAAAASPTGSVESAVVGNLSNEAGQNVDQSLGQIRQLESIYVRERTGIRVLVLHRFMRSSPEGQ